jgi:hypothetical protein
MHSAAALPAVLYGLVYAAGEHEMSFLGAEMSRYAGPVLRSSARCAGGSWTGGSLEHVRRCR